MSLFQPIRERTDARFVRHISGPVQPPEHARATLLCRVENGAAYIPSFLAHYRRLGVGHMIFLDTGSSDGTLNLLQGSDITVFRTNLPFKTHRLWMHRWLMRRCPRGMWTLNVDIDELFEYPRMSHVSLSSLLDYMDAHHFTAMRAHMVDCFASCPVGSADAPPEAPLIERYPWFDLSDIEQLQFPQYFGTKLPSYRGGIRKKIFRSNHFWITKHPLLRRGWWIKPYTYSEHTVKRARLADVTGALLHFKFTEGFPAYVDDAIRRGQHWNDSREYHLYAQALRDNPHLSLKLDTARRWAGPDALVETGFLQASPTYAAWLSAAA